MVFCEYTRSTLIDFAPYSSLMVFVSGCNLRCDFCYNTDIVLNKTRKEYSEEYILNEIDKYRDYLDAVIISGGEPTLKQKQLIPFLQEINNRGLLLKLDSNLTIPLESDFIQYFQGITFSPKPTSFYSILPNSESVLKIIENNIRLINNRKLQFIFKQVRLVWTKETYSSLLYVYNKLKPRLFLWSIDSIPAVFINSHSHFSFFTPCNSPID